jgi:biopolymer transport protein ExbB
MIWLYQAIGAIRDFLELGGDVLWAIMFALFLMWTFILERLWYFYRVYPGRKRTIVQAWEARFDTDSWYARRIREGLLSQAALELKQNIGLIKALIAVCPLLGLLGTVTGMISVFDVMTHGGGGNARALAGGVSTATVPTMAGMVAALSGVYFGTWLEHKAQVEAETLENLLQHHDATSRG